ncbi:uncharacterized protein SETTUDRAFT_169334 [Exserohilum turcica Et28A]|uniref:Uncharacterized protein n=1 Tax=Exserohilum turcicum (strain 28A) TaxID=671987 RepID=R0KA01_EXST2|nr:uncharacterized protein SETTUDRAFT_169334 [Exserohilum turcica Et28A]EOA86234.1 hypothetical protein SETTUDRAFT_169334 [Exserohilum turcica Et28A]
MHSLEVVGLAAAMLVIPLTMHRAVQGFDDMYEMVGRRSKSPYARMSWVNIMFAAIIMVGWHLWLGRLTYLTVLEGGEDDQEHSDADADASSSTDRRSANLETRAISWGRLLGRLFIPLLLGALGLHFGYRLLLRATVDPRPLITRNDVDMQEAMAQLYGLS